MTIDFFYGGPIDYHTESHAIYRLAKALYTTYGTTPDAHYIFIANILTQVAPLPKSGDKLYHLPQLDAVLIGPTFMALIDFKHCPHPIRFPIDEKATWYAFDPHGGRYPLKGGNSNNPRIQARKAHWGWSHHLRNQMATILAPARQTALAAHWVELKGWVLFYPQLHPANKPVPTSPRDHLWLQFAGVDEITELVFAANSRLILQQREMAQVARQVFKGKPWVELAQLFKTTIGYLELPSSDSPAIAYPVGSFESKLIGRSRTCPIQIPQISQYAQVSANHARLETSHQAVRLFDDNSRHGTFINGQRVDETGGQLLHDGDEITLGGLGQVGACRLRFKLNPHLTDNISPHFTDTTQ